MKIPEKFQEMYNGEWTRLDVSDLRNQGEDKEFASLWSFVRTLEFCNSVVSVSSEEVRNQFLEYFYSGFLVNVLAPSLVQTNPREIIATTAYLELVLRVITSQDLIWAFLRLLVCHHVSQNNGGSKKSNQFDAGTYHYDGIILIEIFIGRLASQNQYIAITTLALFSTLVSLSCEDLMVQIIFQYLVPRNHILRKYLGESDEAWALHKSSLWFLEQMPKCVRPDRMDNRHEIFKPLNEIQWNLSKEVDIIMPPEEMMTESKVAVSDYDVNNDLSVTISMKMGLLDDNLEKLMQQILPAVNSTPGRLNTLILYEKSAIESIYEYEKRCRGWTSVYNWQEPFDDIVITMYNTQLSPISARRKSGNSNPLRQASEHSLPFDEMENGFEKVKSDRNEGRKGNFDGDFQDLNDNEEDDDDDEGDNISVKIRRKVQKTVEDLKTQNSMEENEILSPNPETPSKLALELSNLHDETTKDEEFFELLDVTNLNLNVQESDKPLDRKFMREIFRMRGEKRASETSLPGSVRMETETENLRTENTQNSQNTQSTQNTQNAQNSRNNKNSRPDLQTTSAPKTSSQKPADHRPFDQQSLISDSSSHENFGDSSFEIHQMSSDEEMYSDNDDDDFIEDDWLTTTNNHTPENKKFGSFGKNGNFGSSGLNSENGAGQYNLNNGSSSGGKSSKLVNNSNSAYVGPFLGMILSRLEQIQSKSIPENLLLCELISRLCSYSQPLLRSFLLDTALPLQPSIQNLAQVISSARVVDFWSKLFFGQKFRLLVIILPLVRFYYFLFFIFILQSLYQLTNINIKLVHLAFHTVSTKHGQH